METTFMTIHNLTPQANILFASESIIDVLGYQPYEVIGRSCFDYFHPDEVPIARNKHDRSIRLDKASVLYYSRIKARDGSMVCCECVFSVVFDVLVACTSIYRQGSMNAELRALEAPQVRRLFASSPRDPRYHMLEHLSSRFRIAPSLTPNEPRAALILNRFSRELPIMYSTNAVHDILGVTAQEMTGKSFYECIAEECLPDAIRSLESAKANDSIAYLRFVYRDPRRAEDLERLEREASHSSDSEDGGVPIDVPAPHEDDYSYGHVEQREAPKSVPLSTRTDSGSSATQTENEEIFDVAPNPRTNHSNRNFSHPYHTVQPQVVTPIRPPPPLELEAIISCTSDGLVVILRAARPSTALLGNSASPTNLRPISIFAAPWAPNGLLPADSSGEGTMGIDFMSSIREVAVFAWSLTGINGKIAGFGHGTPRGEAVPPRGFPIWEPQWNSAPVPPRMVKEIEMGPGNQAWEKWQDWERDGRIGYGGYDRVLDWRERGGPWVFGGGVAPLHQPTFDPPQQHNQNYNNSFTYGFNGGTPAPNFQDFSQTAFGLEENQIHSDHMQDSRYQDQTMQDRSGDEALEGGGDGGQMRF